MYFLEVVDLVAAYVLLVDDPFAVRRPERVELTIVRLQKLGGPSAGGAYLPEIEAPREIGTYDDFFTVGRPGLVMRRE